MRKNVKQFVKRGRTSGRSQPKVQLLQARICELEETLAAIRCGGVDALVVSGPGGDQVFTLQGAEQPYRTLVETMNEGAATLDADGAVLYANAKFSEMLGVPLEQCIGSPIQNHVGPSESQALNLLIDVGLRASTKGEICFADRRGRRRLLRLSLSPVTQPDLDMVCVVVTDVTEILEANCALKESENGLRALSAQLLHFQDDERRRISRDLHDVTGQKIAALSISLSQLARSTPQSDYGVQRTISECVALAGEMGREIRTLSYLLHPPLLEELGLLAAIRWYSDGFQDRTGIKVSVEVPDELMRLSPDVEVALFRVVQESLTNVHRYSGSSTAQVRIQVQKQKLTLEVTDQGKGIGKETLTTPGSRSVGLGIQSMRERMRVFSGTLEITDLPTGGTRVMATLPIEGQERGDLPTSPYPSWDSSPISRDSEEPVQRHSVKRILIADGHEVLRHGIRRMLESEPDLEVCAEAVDGQDAVNKTMDLQPDLVILGVTMPVLNGLVAAQQILRHNPLTRVLVFTVHESSYTAREIMEAGAHGYLPKARAAQDLICAVKAVLEGRSFFSENSESTTA